MKVLSMFIKTIGIGITKAINLMIDVISLFVMAFYVMRSIVKVVYYGVKLNIVKLLYNY